MASEADVKALLLKKKSMLQESLKRLAIGLEQVRGALMLVEETLQNIDELDAGVPLDGLSIGIGNGLDKSE